MTRTIARDKTTKTEFSVHLSIAFEWLPFIGTTAFSLYALYRAMAQTGQEMGTRKIGKVMGVSYESVRRYTNLLAHCGLIDVQPGTYTTPNRVEIIDPPDLDSYLIAEIMAELHTDPHFAPMASDGQRRPTRTLLAIAKRAAAWQLPDTTTAAPYTNGSSAAPTATATAALSARLQRVCDEHGSNAGSVFNGADSFVSSTNQPLLTGWLDAIENNPAIVRKIDGVAGWIRKKVSSGAIPPAPKQERQQIPDEYKDYVIS